MEAETDVLIIGSGFAGLGSAIKLRKAGIENFVVLEQAAGVGGTWRDNHYPGVACDVPSHLYSFSFEPNPNWSHLFAEQREILAYLDHCADKYGVRPHIRFDSRVSAARFDERRGTWQVTTSDGRLFRTRALVVSTGGLSCPSYPSIPGIERFVGKMFHTARWDDSYSLEGKRVGVIGTGASAIQVVPSIAPLVAELKLFQRTPPWVLPKPPIRMGRRAKRRFARYPWLQKALRNFIYLFLETRVLGFTNMLPSLQEGAERRAREHLNTAVADPVLRAKLTPDYRIGCKRILLSSDYYSALQRENVEVVCDGIREINERGIVGADGREHALDAIVFATGFSAAEYIAPFEVRGRNGAELGELWRGGAEGYLGTTVSGFPNLFTVSGPNTGLGHTSMVFMIESQIQYVVDAVSQIRRHRLRWVDVKPSVQAAYNARLQQRLAGTVWEQGGCVSWYRTRTGKNTTLWPGFTFEFRYRTRRFDLENYQTVSESAPRLLEPAALQPEHPSPSAP